MVPSGTPAKYGLAFAGTFSAWPHDFIVGGTAAGGVVGAGDEEMIWPMVFMTLSTVWPGAGAAPALLASVLLPLSCPLSGGGELLTGAG